MKAIAAIIAALATTLDGGKLPFAPAVGRRIRRVSSQTWRSRQEGGKWTLEFNRSRINSKPGHRWERKNRSWLGGFNPKKGIK